MILFLAKFISLILGPVVWIPAMIYVFLNKAQLPPQSRFILFIAYGVFMFIAPFAYVIFSYFKGRISDLDISVRQQRYKYLFLFIFSLTTLTCIIYIFGTPLLLKLQILILLIVVVNTIITFFWKISFHMTTNIVGSLIVNFLFDWKLTYLYLTIPLIFWSRLYLKRHTVPQLLGALILNGAITLLYFKLS